MDIPGMPGLESLDGYSIMCLELQHSCRLFVKTTVSYDVACAPARTNIRAFFKKFSLGDNVILIRPGPDNGRTSEAVLEGRLGRGSPPPVKGGSGMSPPRKF